jgi:hypothetical protein
MRAEVLTDDAVIIFIGSELEARRPRNFPGSSVFMPFPGRRVAGIRNLHDVVSRPCGLMRDGQLARYQTHFRDIMLPLAPSSGHLPQIITLSWDWNAASNPTPGPDPPTFEWLDIGAGVPSYPPR